MLLEEALPLAENSRWPFTSRAPGKGGDVVENLLSTQTSTRGLTFILVFVALFSGYLLLRSAAGQTGTQLQSAAESAISILTVTVGVLAMVRLYRLLTELEQAKMAAEAANRSRSQALAITSHEIRTPMQVIMGMTELALRTELSDEPRQYLEAMQTSSEILLRVVNDILDFSKMEAGRLDLKPVTLHLRDTVERATRPLLVRAHQAGLGLATTSTPTYPTTLLVTVIVSVRSSSILSTMPSSSLVGGM